MDKICAIVDCQGFQFKDRFVAREIAIVSDFISQCQELNPDMNWRSLCEDDQQVVLHSTKFKHGLHYCPFNNKNYCYIYHSNDVNIILQTWYDMIATEEKPFFAYKNQQLGNILKAAEIPCIDLDAKEFNFPSYKEIQKKYGDNYLCAYHKKPRINSNIQLICALRKAAQLYRELKSILSELMVE